MHSIVKSCWGTIAQGHHKIDNLIMRAIYLIYEIFILVKLAGKLRKIGGELKVDTGINLFCYGNGDVLSVERQIELMAENGFEHTFIMADDPCLTDSLVDKVKRAGMVFDMLHAPFDGINSMWKSGSEGDRMLKTLTDSIDMCAAYEIPVLVVHLSSGRPAPVINDAGNRRFSLLMDAARRKNITVAYENQRFLANLASAFEQYPDAGFCWDVGHEECFAGGRRYMPLFGDRLSVVHIHDNHHMPDEDEHLLPFDGICDYEMIARFLAEYNFGGSIMLEVFRSQSNLYNSMSPEEYYRRAGKAAKKIADMVEMFKQNS